MPTTNAINIYTDGAMDYDSKQTGGTGYVIIFPEERGLPDLEESFRRDQQGIHRLEMIAILEAILALVKWAKGGNAVLVRGSRVIIHTDRLSLTDEEQLNPWRIADWRKNDWKNHEGKPIKHVDLLDEIDKARKKLYRELGSRAEIKYVRRKLNRKADKLSKAGKKGATKHRKLISDKISKVSKRLFDGDEVGYSDIEPGEGLKVRVYLKDHVQNEFEIKAEIVAGAHKGKYLRIYVSSSDEQELHRQHFYEIEVMFVYKDHVRIRSDFVESG